MIETASTAPLTAPTPSPTDTNTLGKVVVGMSGGVDSSTVTAMLQDQGYDVIGMTLWLMKGKGSCCTDALVDAAKLCEELGIPHHIVDTRELFEKNIVNYLVDGYSDGITPLPCSQCNKAVKFGPMLDFARDELGVNRIATGHYARLGYDKDRDRHQLIRAVDRRKDQTYFLYDLSQDVLGSVLFPLGDYEKTETRQIAHDHNLHVADKPESQDLCLVETHGSMQAFLDKYIDRTTGDIVNRQDGKVLGTHTGIHHYTIGQRKGLGVSAPEPLYVVGLDAVMNRVLVDTRDRATSPDCTVSRVNWVSIANPGGPIKAEVQIRYRSPAVPATVTPLDETGSTVKIEFDDPQFSITPGQAAVWYHGDILLGGGIINRPL